MSRTTDTITLSLPPAMTKKIEKLMAEEQRTRSELFREALRQYIENKEWKEILRYGQMKAIERGIKKKDVDRMIHEYRGEKRKT